MSIFKKSVTSWGSNDNQSPSSSSSLHSPFSTGSSRSASSPSSTALDFTKNLRDRMFYKPGHLRSLGLMGEITTMAIDPSSSLLAVGTSNGMIHLIGSPAFQCTLRLGLSHANSGLGSSNSTSNNSAGPTGVKFLTFHPGASRLVAIDTKDTLHSWWLGPGCMDDSKGTPVKETTASLYGEVTYVHTPSPAQSHILITMRDGNTLAYDLVRRNLSPYKIPNCWAQYEERLRRSGVPGRATKSFTISEGVCIAPSPRDFNTLLIAYEGGVVSWDVKEKIATNTFEMVLPPGSPGGANYADDIIWKERTPAVTCVAWRDDGLVFAVGHEDGCIAIWALEDPDKPLMVRTIEKEDVNVTDAESLFDAGALDTQVRGMRLSEQGHATREPIFKLTWVSFPDEPTLRTMMTPQWTEQGYESPSNQTIDYSNRGETLLMVLGGSLSNQSPAINLLQMPAYTPPPPRPGQTAPGGGAGGSGGLSLTARSAYRDSLSVSGITQYQTETPAEDFLLIPRNNPFFDLAHDPISIIILMTPNEHKLPPVDGPYPRRSVAAWTFPPPRSDVPPAETGRKDIRTAEHEIENIVPMTAAPHAPSSPNHLAGRQMQRQGSNQSQQAASSSWRMPWLAAPASPNLRNASLPIPDAGFRSKQARSTQALRLPSIFWTGETAVIGCEMYPLENDAFRQLISHAIETEGREPKPRLDLKGGTAVPDLKSPNAPEPITIRLEKYRVLVTWSLDGAVRFWDVSPHILVLPSPLRFEYPSPLPHLTVSVSNILTHPSIAHTSLAQLYAKYPSRVRISGVRFATESNELAIIMHTGELIVYKFERGTGRTEEPGYFPEQAQDDGRTWEEIVSLDHLADNAQDGFKPKFMLDIKRGAIASVALSDVGFLAVSYTENSLVIVDLRGPDIVLREGFTAEGKKVKWRKTKTQDLPAESSICRQLSWSICHVGGQGVMAPRLIASYTKGLTKIFTLHSVLGEWLPENKTITFTHDSLANPLLSAVLDVERGNEIGATRDRLVTAMQQSAEGGKGDGKRLRCIWVAASWKAVRCHADFTGDRLAKYELRDGEEFMHVVPVTKNGFKVLMAIKTNGVADILSLPALEPIASVRLDFGLPGRRLGRFSIDSSSGDYIEYISPMEIYVRTLFSWRKPLPPRLDPCTIKHALPPVPLPKPVGWGDWLWGLAPMTGAQFDAIIAGPERPPVQKPVAPRKPAAPLITWGEVEEKVPVYKRPEVKSAASSSNTNAATTLLKPVRSDIYSEMTRAVRERGNMMESLEDQMESMTQSAVDYVNTARKTAAKQTAKAATKSLFGF